MFLTYEPKENTKSSSHIPRRGDRTSRRHTQRKMRVRAQQFASKRQPQHAHEHTGQGLRDPSRLRYARPTEKHFESNRAPPRGSNDSHPTQSASADTTVPCALETKTVRTPARRLGFETTQPCHIKHMPRMKHCLTKAFHGHTARG